MLHDTITWSGHHPDVVVEGRQGEIRTSATGTFWIRYCELVETGELQNVEQIPGEAQTLIVKWNEGVNEEKLDDIIASIQAYLTNALVFDTISDNDTRCIVTASKRTTTAYFPYCRLISKEIALTHMPAITKILADKYQITVTP